MGEEEEGKRDRDYVALLLLQVLKYQLELSQFKQEVERKLAEKEDEVESMRYICVCTVSPPVLVQC